MKPKKPGVILPASMAMAPIVSAADDQSENELRTLIEANYVPADTARNHAMFALNNFVGSGVLGQKEIWLGAVVNQNPTVIHDVNGTKLFYLFAIEKNQGKIGEIKIAASKLVGTSVYTIGPEKNTLELTVLEQKALAESGKYAKKGTPVSTKLVSYAYPKIGMMAEYTDDQTNTTQKLIIDTYDYAIIPDRSPRYEGDRGIVPFYTEKTREKQSDLIDSWSRFDRKVSNISNNSSPSLKMSPGSTVSGEGLELFASQSVSSTAATEYRVLSSFPLIGGETTEWCTVGTADMISDWYGVSRTQTAIAGRMGIPTTPPYRGANINEELNFYQGSLASGGLGKSSSLDYYSINWYDSKEEINNNRPFKVGDNGHARAAVGYYRDPSTDDTYFYFKDPSPLNAGSEYWEWFDESDSHFYNNHIKIK